MGWAGLPVLLLVLGRVLGGFANSDFNASLRDYSAVENVNNNTAVRTLQTGGQMNYPKFEIPRGPMVTYTEFPDNAISSSSYHSRGLVRHEPGYEVQDYDEGPHGPYYGPYGHHHQPGPFNHFGHEHDYPLDYHHHKHYDPGLTAKAILLPVAGLAILGAAAALVTNPVLLQLGVVSGRRRRDAAPDHTYPTNPNNRLLEKLLDPVYETSEAINRKTDTSINSGPRIRRHPARPLTVHRVPEHNGDDYTLVPIPLKIRERHGFV